MAFFDTRNLRGDIMGGVTTGVVALPLALAFGEASGAGPIAGLYGAIIVGFFAAMFGGTGANVSGPTGPMIVVFAGVFASLSGDPALVFLAVILAGVIQILLGVFKFGQYIKLVPYPVVSGFMSGIGCIIIALQTARLFGHEPIGKGTIPALQSIPGAVADPNWVALLLGVLTLAIVFFWPKNLGKWIPGALAALLIGTVLSIAIPGAPILGDIPTGLPSLVVPAFEADAMFIVLEAAILLALLGAIDSLLTSLVADNMTRTQHDSDKELIGQGIGNSIAGFFGAIPGAGATMRTVVNIRSGGSTKISGMIHGVLLFAVAIVLAPLASQIPHAVLAGILVKVGYDIIDVAYLKRAHRGPRWDLALMVVVLTLTVFVDLITAVAVGVVLAALAFVKQTADEQLKSLMSIEPRTDHPEELKILREAKGRITMFDFGGPLSFGAAADLGHQVRDKWKDGHAALIMDFSRTPNVDLSAIKAIETIAEDAEVAGKQLLISGASGEINDLLHGLDVGQKIPEAHWFDSRQAALNYALSHLKKNESMIVEEEKSSGKAANQPAE